MRTLLAFAALLWAVALAACTSTVPKPGLSAADAPRVAACQSIGNTRDNLVIGDIVISGGASAAGVAAAAMPSTSMGLKTGLTIGSAIGAGIAMTGATIAVFESQAFENGKCTDVVGALPDLPPAPAMAAPAPAPAPALAPPADAGAPHATLPPGTTEFVVSLDPLRSTACQPCYARGQGCSCVGAECGCVP